MGNPALMELLASDYADGREQLDLDELRSRRDKCQQAEEALSLQRRMVQGRLDIVQAEIYRRAGDASAHGKPVADLVAELPSILIEHGDRHLGPGRLTLVGGSNHAELDTEFDQVTALLNSIVSPNTLLALHELEDENLHKIANDLETVERSISQNRRQLHRNIDALQDEVVRRYKTGEASVDKLLRDNS